jgi:hypothetical protein
MMRNTYILPKSDHNEAIVGVDVLHVARELIRVEVEIIDKLCGL